MNKIRQFFKLLGPGLLYAGAAVGVSHLVQSTRAGAEYGFQLIWILILANIIKYPFFEFGTRYAAATGNNLIEGYRKIGWWAVTLYALLTVGTMFAIMAAVTIVTAGLVGNVFHISLEPVQISAFIMIVTTIVLLIGKYQVLDKMIKWVIVILAFSTFTALFFAFGDIGSFYVKNQFSWSNQFDIFFMIAFIGWMPAPLDVSVWQSMWGQAKSKDIGFRISLSRALLDFRVGYIGTVILALGFLSLGALIMYGSGEDLSDKGLVFAGQLINLYTKSIGNWAYYIIAIAAIATMFSTTLTCLDAYPRIMKELTNTYFPSIKNRKFTFDFEYLIWIIVVFLGTILLLSVLNETMGFMVDLATTISFVTAPLLAILNFRVVTRKDISKAGKPGRFLRIYAIGGIIFLSSFTTFYLVWRWFL